METNGNNREDVILDANSDGSHLQQSDPEDHLKNCLQNLFSGPSRSLESAFGVLLGMIQDQSAEQKKLKDNQKELRSEYDTKLRHLEDLHHSSVASHEEEQKKYQETLTSLQTEQENLEKSQQKLSNELAEIKEEIRVMAYNFHGFEEFMVESSTPPKEKLQPESDVTPETSKEPEVDAAAEVITLEKHLEEESHEENREKNKEVLDERGEDKEEEREGGQEENTNKEEVENETKAQDCEEDSKSDKDSDGESSDESESDNDEETPVTPLKNVTTHLSRRASINVAKHKLNADMTLAVRMERLEEARIDLERGLRELNEMHLQAATKPVYDDLPSSSDLKKVSLRISAVEQFLGGFDESLGQSSGCGQSLPQSNDDNESSSRTEVNISGTERTSQNSVEGNDDISQNVALNETAKEQDKEPRNICSSKDQEEHSKDNKYTNECGNENLTSNIPTTPTTSEKSTELPNDLQNRAVKRGNQPGGLMIYLKDQEKRTKNDLNELAQQLSVLSDKLSQRISRKSVQLHLTNLKLGRETPSNTESDDNNSLSAFAEDMEGLRAVVLQLENELHEKVSSSMLNLEFQALLEKETGNAVEETNSKPLEQFKSKLDEELESLKQNKVDKLDLSNEIKESEAKLSSEVDDKFSAHQASLTDTLNAIQDDMNACREYINLLETKLIENQVGGVPEDVSPRDFADKDYLDAMIKQATDDVQVSLEESMRSRLDELKAMEDDIENLASKLSEKPDQEQINRMIVELEETLSQRNGHDHAIQMILDNIKIELRQRMTRAEVLSLVKHLLDEAKQGLKNTKESLMIGRVPYRCIGCNQAFPSGVNGRLAQKVNHRALPSSSGSVSGMYSQRKQGRMRGRPGALRPLQLSHTPGRPRTTGTMRPPVRPSSMDYMRSTQNRSR